MARSTNSSSEARVPAALIAERRAGWHAFTRGIFLHCVALAVLLLLMLLFLRIL